MPEDPTTEELASEQVQRELAERRAEEGTGDREQALTHRRRADKARYLRERLAERAKSEKRGATASSR
jgi:hypothetical protein